MSKIDQTYHQLLNTILEVGYKYPDPNRKGVERLEIPNYTFRHEFKDGFPAITTKKLHYKNVVTELLWFLKGDTNIKYLIDNGCNIWNKDAYNYYLKHFKLGEGIISEIGAKPMTMIQFIQSVRDGGGDWLSEGGLGPVYGKQWRNFNGIDQIKDLIQRLKEKPLGTEHIVNAWNPADKSHMALPPCHYGFQIVVRPLTYTERLNHGRERGLICKTTSAKNAYKEWNAFFLKENISKYGFELHWNQRSVDTFLGLPYNIASYATLALIIEKITGYKALAIQGDLKKVHLYDNSLDAVKEQLSRDPNKFNQSKLKFKEDGEDPSGFIYTLQMGYLEDKCDLHTLIEEMQIDDFQLENYESYPTINVEMKERDE